MKQGSQGGETAAGESGGLGLVGLGPLLAWERLSRGKDRENDKQQQRANQVAWFPATEGELLNGHCFGYLTGAGLESDIRRERETRTMPPNIASTQPWKAVVKAGELSLAPAIEIRAAPASNSRKPNICPGGLGCRENRTTAAATIRASSASSNPRSNRVPSGNRTPSALEVGAPVDPPLHPRSMKSMATATSISIQTSSSRLRLFSLMSEPNTMSPTEERRFN